MSDRSKIKRTRFLLLFFVPVALALLCGTALNFLIENKLRDIQARLDREQQQHLQTAAEASNISLQSLLVQRDLTLALSQAKAGVIGEAEIYKIHSQIVDRLANFEKRLGTLVIDDELTSSGIKPEVPVQAFSDFKQFVLMSTDLAAIDPSLASQYLAKAGEPYTAFAVKLHAIDEAMTQHTLDRHIASSRELLTYGNRMRTLSFAGTLALILVWLMIALRLTRRLDVLSTSLTALAGHDEHAHSALFEQVNVMARHHKIKGTFINVV